MDYIVISMHTWWIYGPSFIRWATIVKVESNAVSCLRKQFEQVDSKISHTPIRVPNAIKEINKWFYCTVTCHTHSTFFMLAYLNLHSKAHHCAHHILSPNKFLAKYEDETWNSPERERERFYWRRRVDADRRQEGRETETETIVSVTFFANQSL